MRRLALFTAIAALLAPAAARADMPGPDHNFPVTREGDASLPDHTIIRPADVNAVPFKMPIVVWGNGGCRDSNEEFHYFLMHFAAYGYFVIANGQPQNPYHPEELGGLVNPQPQKLVAGIDWAFKHAAELHLDTSRVAVMGQSCGGWEATDASADKRVGTTVIWDSGASPYHPQGVTALHAPVLYAYGGTSDYAEAFPLASYQATSVPTVLASHDQAGHTGMWDDPSDGTPPPGPYQNEPLVIAPHWLNFIFYGHAADRGYFLGSACGLCTRPEWTVQSKNWDGFASAPVEAPPASSATPAPAQPAACQSRRTIVVHPRRRLRSAVVTVDGRRVKTLRGGEGVRLRFAGQGARTVVVRIAGRDARGRRLVDVRRYRLCARRV
jgi:dienelactone hydrolase